MFNQKTHGHLITLSEEQDLSQANKKKLEAWRKAFAKDPKRCEVLRFVPSRKQFYEGAVRGILWPGQTIHNTANGVPHVTPSDMYEIPKLGYCPKNEAEAIRLLLLSQDMQNRFCLFEDRELEAEAKAANLDVQRLKEEGARKDEEMEELRQRLAKLEQKKG